MEFGPGLKEFTAASDEWPLSLGGELSSGSSSLDNPELFQEKSPKKKNRLVASR